MKAAQKDKIIATVFKEFDQEIEDRVIAIINRLNAPVILEYVKAIVEKEPLDILDQLRTVVETADNEVCQHTADIAVEIQGLLEEAIEPYK